MATKRITGILPAPTLAQRIRSMSSGELMIAARGLAKDEKHTALVDSLLAELEKRAGFEAVEAFATEIFA